MRVVFDATAYTPTGKGLSRYIANLLARMACKARAVDAEYVVVVNRHPGNDLPNIVSGERVRVVAVDYQSLIRWKIFGLPHFVRANPCDLLHCPDQLAPVTRGIRTVVTVHELYRFRRRLDPLSRRLLTRAGAAFFVYELLFRATLRRVSRVITVSGATRADLLKTYSIPEHRVAVTHEAADHIPLWQGAEPPQLSRPYVVSFATGDSREVPFVLLTALARLRAQLGDCPVVVFVGAKPALRSRLEATARRLRVLDRVQCVGFVSDSGLRTLMSGAVCFVELSRYEGFGLQVLEAMASGAAVVGSRLPAVEEVAGDTALLVDPQDASAVAAAVARLLLDEALRTSKVAAGIRRSAGFSWRATAEETLNVYSAAIRGSESA